MLLSEEENQLVAATGIYGVWLLMNAPKIQELYETKPPDGPPLVDAGPLREAYKEYVESDSDDRCVKLFNTIDEFCRKNNWPHPLGPYDDALRELLDIRRKKLLEDVMAAVQRYQPPGSPPPGNELAIVEWVLRSLAEQVKTLRGSLAELIGRADRARSILTDGNPRPDCRWGVLDTTQAAKTLAENSLPPLVESLLASPPPTVPE